MSLGILGMRHDLFKTAPTSYPINFVAGDVFDPDTHHLTSQWLRSLVAASKSTHQAFSSVFSREAELM